MNYEMTKILVTALVADTSATVEWAQDVLGGDAYGVAVSLGDKLFLVYQMDNNPQEDWLVDVMETEGEMAYCPDVQGFTSRLPPSATSPASSDPGGPLRRANFLSTSACLLPSPVRRSLCGREIGSRPEPRNGEYHG